jgi:uncharacterized protein (TIGR03067 family)
MCVRGILPLAVVFLVAADEPAKDAKKELDNLQGEWRMVSMERRGKKRLDEDVVQFKLTISGNRYLLTYADAAPTAAMLEIAPSKGPRAIDLRWGDKKVLSRGIYKREGDTLTLCYAVGDAERPKDFKTTAEAGVLVVWKRAKK